MSQNGARGISSDVGYDSGLGKVGLAWVKIEACTGKQVEGFLEPAFFYLSIDKVYDQLWEKRAHKDKVAHVRRLI